MATRYGVLDCSRDDLEVEESFATERLEAESFEDPPDIARWDPETDQPVIRQRYAKPGHEEIDERGADRPL